MRGLKRWLEKPTLIWLAIGITYILVFSSSQRARPLEPGEEAALRAIRTFSESSFPPRIHVIRELKDWGHVGFYTVMGQVSHAAKGDPGLMRGTSLFFVLAAFYLFLRLARRFTYQNRLSPIWISAGLATLAANPFAWKAAFGIGYVGMLLFLLLLALQFFERERLGLAGLCAAVAVLVDWRALLLPVMFVFVRMTSVRGKLLRPERALALILPFAAASLPLIAWKGVLPEGEARQWWDAFRRDHGVVALDRLFYALALLPLYVPVFSWGWGLRARSRALILGAIAAAVAIPLYFLFPIGENAWNLARFGEGGPFGGLDALAALAAGEYKNFALFFPAMAGAFLLAQAALMDVLDRSRILRGFILFFFAAQLAVAGGTDEQFLLVIPFAILLSLSEALVGEEGKLA